MRRELGDFEASCAHDAEKLVAVVLALGGALQIDEALIPCGDLYAGKA